MALFTSPTIAFNAANVAFNISQNNNLGAVISGSMSTVSAGMTVLDSWKNRSESSSYKANAAYQGVLGLSFVPKLFVGSADAAWEAGKGIALYGLATAGHWLRSEEEEEAKAAGQTMDEYYQSFAKGPVKYSQSYYGATEFIAINAGHDPSAVASVITLMGIGRALNDQKFWDLEGTRLQPLRQLTAPRIFVAGYAVSTAAATLQGDWWFAASQAAWGWGNANFDLVGPKVKKAIKRRYANDPEKAEEALKGLEVIKQEVGDIGHEMLPVTAKIKNEDWNGASKKAIELYDQAKGNPSRQAIYLEVIRTLAQESLSARRKLNQLRVECSNVSSEAGIEQSAVYEPL